ncbi:unnamed protein product [Adineta steineri]|uniref:Uncharacterized protein n=1 Tax=Adineta steineri TaxID=433720 RepID=A0A819P8E1_9BILA|nr:unnamed protein product [Adineta steineri]CAF4008971.1 unnamed protein product [Adineta steineri]
MYHQMLLVHLLEKLYIWLCNVSVQMKLIWLAQSPGGRSRSFSADANGYAKGKNDAERDGDPIEANCLDRFFNRSNLDPPLLLGSIKSNLGHTEGAAGGASLIKVTMCVNSFGMGDTTTHVIIEEYQPINKTSIENGHIDDGNHIKSKQYFLFSFSNNDDDQAFLQRIYQQLLLKRTISYTHSAIFVFLNQQQLQEQINAFLNEQSLPGPQWWSMGRQLYESEPLFNKWINLIDGGMTKINKGEWRLLEELIEKKNEQESRINDTNIAQPTLFGIQVALSALLAS